MRGEGRNMRMRTIFALSLIFCVVLLTIGSTNIKSEDFQNPEGWSEDVRLTEVDGEHSLIPDIAVDSENNIHVVWYDARDEYWGVYYLKSSDDGSQWSEKKRVNAPLNSGQSPSIAVYQNVVHIVWDARTQEETKGEIYYKNSTDGGLTWADDKRLTHASGDSFTPEIAVDANILHVVWSDERDGDFEIYYKKSMDSGSSWSDDIRLTNASSKSQIPQVAVDSIDNVHVVWQDERDGNFEIYYKKSTNNGETWEEDVRLTNASGRSEQPCILVDSNDVVYVFWADRRDGKDYHIYYKKSTNYGGTWSDDVKITTEGDFNYPAATTDLNDNIHLVFRAYPPDESNVHIHYVRSIDGGDMWIESYQLTNDSIMAMHPAIAVDMESNLHIVWHDARDYNESALYTEIYYKRTLNPVTEPPITVIQSLNQTTCKPGDSILVSGNAVYNDSIVPTADVSIKILETDDEWTTMTDSDGDYSKTITAPDTPGNYTVRVTITSGNHTGWKQMRLTVEQENTNGGNTNGGTTNGGQQSDGEGNNQGINFNYVIVTIGVIAILLLIAGALLRMKKSSTKVRKTKIEKTGVVKTAEKISTITLRCPGCKNAFNVREKEKPFKVKCPFCDKEGTIK